MRSKFRFVTVRFLVAAWLAAGETREGGRVLDPLSDWRSYWGYEGQTA